MRILAKTSLKKMSDDSVMTETGKHVNRSNMTFRAAQSNNNTVGKPATQPKEKASKKPKTKTSALTNLFSRDSSFRS
jgi:hypothetical protein